MAVAALITWIVTAGFGLFMLGTWLRNGGARAGAGSHFRAPLVLGHFLLAAAGLVVWIVYVVNGSTVLAWVAFADLVVVAGIGDTLVYRWFKDHQAAAHGGPVAHRPDAAAGSTMVQGTGVALAEQHIPTAAVAVHGLVAVTTVVLVLLAALGVGG